MNVEYREILESYKVFRDSNILNQGGKVSRLSNMDEVKIVTRNNLCHKLLCMSWQESSEFFKITEVM